MQRCQRQIPPGKSEKMPIVVWKLTRKMEHCRQRPKRLENHGLFSNLPTVKDDRSIGPKWRKSGTDVRGADGGQISKGLQFQGHSVHVS